MSFRAPRWAVVGVLGVVLVFSARTAERQVATAGGVGVPTSCDAPLHLTLKPGLSYPPGVVLIHPAANSPRSPVSLALPLYPGATPSSTPLVSPDLTYPADRYVHSANAEFALPVSPAVATAWYRTAFAACGYIESMRGPGETGTTVVSTSAGFTIAGDPRREVVLVFQATPAHGSLALYVATERIYPPRPAASLLPSAVEQVSLDMWVGLPQIVTDHVIIRRPHIIHRLVRAINALSDLEGGPLLCPAHDLGARLRFLRPGGGAVDVTIDACSGVMVGRFGPYTDNGGNVWQTVRWADIRCDLSPCTKARG